MAQQMVALMSPIDDPGGTTLEGHTLQDPVIATAMFWMSRYTHKQVQELIERSFSQDEILEGMVNLSNLLNLPQPMKHRDTERRPGAEAQSQSLYALLDELDAQGKIPNLVVPFGKLNLLARAFSNSSPLDTNVDCLGAKLKCIESKIAKLDDKLNRISIGPKPAPTINVHQAEIMEQPTAQPSFSNTVINGGNRGRTEGGRSRGSGSNRQSQVDRSPSTKRTSTERDTDKEGFIRVERKKKNNLARTGTSNVSLSSILPDGVGGKIQYWIGNTTPTLDTESLKEALVVCADNLNDGSLPKMETKDMEIIELTPTNIENPHSRSWRITVPAKFKNIFDKDNLYPAPWRHRKFYQPRSKPGAKNGDNSDNNQPTKRIKPSSDVSQQGRSPVREYISIYNSS